MMSPDCSTCETSHILTGYCTKQEIQNCLRDSTCRHCDSDEYWYPYGPYESRNCLVCGAEWPVTKIIEDYFYRLCNIVHAEYK